MKPQPYPHYVVLDFEATCDDENPPEPQEVIELPSVLLSGPKLEVVDEFSSFVRPLHHPELRPFCTALTSITSAELRDAPLFPVVFAQHEDWLRGHGLQVHAGDEGSAFRFILCGDWDLQRMLPTQCRASVPPIRELPEAWRSWVNIKRIFETCMEGRARSMTYMLEALGLELVGRHHRGIDDCRNIARIAQALAARGALFEETSQLSRKQLVRLSAP
jgi:inhibitor of KinA sporulation pathway (predicted exonuclease)